MYIRNRPLINFQCKECGMSFASEPSWKKHLFLLHRIKRPQPWDYCNAIASEDRAQTLSNQIEVAGFSYLNYTFKHLYDEIFILSKRLEVCFILFGIGQ